MDHNGACGESSQTVPGHLLQNCFQESFSRLLLAWNSVSTGMAGQGVQGQRLYIISVSNGAIWSASLLDIALGGAQIQLVPLTLPLAL